MIHANVTLTKIGFVEIMIFYFFPFITIEILLRIYTEAHYDMLFNRTETRWQYLSDPSLWDP